MLELVQFIKKFVFLIKKSVLELADIVPLLSYLSARRSKRDEREVADIRYEEQKKQFEAQQEEERERFKEEKEARDKKIRLKEQPMFKFINMERNPLNSKEILMIFNFENGGRGTAYYIEPEIYFSTDLQNYGQKIVRHDSSTKIDVKVDENYNFSCLYCGKENYKIQITISITYRDAHDRKYKQKFILIIGYNDKEVSLYNWPEPELID